MILYTNSFFFRPDLIQYEKLQKSNALYNLNNAFEVAEDKLGLTRLLDPEGNLNLIHLHAFKCLSSSIKVYWHFHSDLGYVSSVKMLIQYQIIDSPVLFDGN